jgi:Flp pilus assembly CpaF family ATPase
VGHTGWIPTNLVFEDRHEFVDIVGQLAADDGTELNAANPSAKVNLSPPGIAETIRCAVALPAVSEDGPHTSQRRIERAVEDVRTAVPVLGGVAGVVGRDVTVPQ